MKRKLHLIGLLLVVAVLSLRLDYAQAQSNKVPDGYVDIYKASNYKLDRTYSLGYMNSSPFSNAYVLENNAGDISAVGDNPASGIWVLSDDRNIAGSAGYLPETKKRYIGNVAFSVKSNYNFSWHALISMKSIGYQDMFLVHPFINAFTGEKIPVLHDVQDAQDWRVTTGLSFHPSMDSKWGFGVNFNFMHVQTLTGTFNLNSQDEATFATMDFAAMHNGQDEDGDGVSYGVRFRNISFANKYSTVNYSPGTNETYERMYGMKRYIPAYMAVGGGYRVSRPSGEKWAFGVEVGPELGTNIPDSSNVAAMNHYTRIGAVKSMFEMGGVLANVTVTYCRPLLNQNLECRLSYLADRYNAAPYVNIGLGNKGIHYYIGYMIPTHNINGFGNQLSIGIRFTSFPN